MTNSVNSDYVAREFKRQILPKLSRFRLPESLLSDLRSNWSFLYASDLSPEQIVSAFKPLFSALDAIWDIWQGHAVGARHFFLEATRAYLSGNDPKEFVDRSRFAKDPKAVVRYEKFAHTRRAP